MAENIDSGLNEQLIIPSDLVTESKPSASGQSASHDFFYDPSKQEVLVVLEGSDGRIQEKRHPFQEFLYALRGEKIKVSTSEWLDLQRALAEGEVQSLDDLYIIARALLVKDVANYLRYDYAFWSIFYIVDSHEQEVQKGQEEDARSEEQIEQEQPTVERQEELGVKEKIDSQEIVQPGGTEQHHGGEDVHKEIEDSRSSGHEGGGETQEDAQEEDKNEENDKRKEGERRGVIRREKKSRSARMIDAEQIYGVFDENRALNNEQLGRALAKLTSIIREASEAPTGRLDAKATVASIAENAGIPELVWEEETERKPKVILMFDVGGSTDDFRPVMEKLFGAAVDYLDDVEVYYFHNAIYRYVWPQKDGNWGEHFIPLSKILKKDRDSRVIIVGDAWMAENELWEDGEVYDRDTHAGEHYPSGMKAFQDLKRTFDHIVWINPIMEKDHEEMDDSGTIGDIKRVFDMYDLTLNGIERAVRRLMEE